MKRLTAMDILQKKLFDHVACFPHSEFTKQILQNLPLPDTKEKAIEILGGAAIPFTKIRCDRCGRDVEKAVEIGDNVYCDGCIRQVADLTYDDIRGQV